MQEMWAAKAEEDNEDLFAELDQMEADEIANQMAEAVPGTGYIAAPQQAAAPAEKEEDAEAKLNKELAAMMA